MIKAIPPFGLPCLPLIIPPLQMLNLPEHDNRAIFRPILSAFHQLDTSLCEQYPDNLSVNMLFTFLRHNIQFMLLLNMFPAYCPSRLTAKSVLPALWADFILAYNLCSIVLFRLSLN